MNRWFILATLIGVSLTTSTAQTPDWQTVEKVLGRKGTVQGDVFKVTFPRTNLNVKVGDISIDPALALTSWIAFKKATEHSMMMGDLVLLDSEIAPALSKLIANGVEVSALHNHIVGETPSVMYMHFAGHGDAAELAKTMMSVLSVTGTPLSAPQSPQETIEHDWSKVESILGRSGQHRGRVLQIGIPRSETINENGLDIPPYMGMATAINFQFVGEKAATTGDFVMLASEVNPVVKALTESGITVTAIHNHMLFESPRLFFLHFWGFNNAEKLATGLRAAVDKTNSVKNK